MEETSQLEWLPFHFYLAIVGNGYSDARTLHFGRRNMVPDPLIIQTCASFYQNYNKTRLNNSTERGSNMLKVSTNDIFQ